MGDIYESFMSSNNLLSQKINDHKIITTKNIIFEGDEKCKF